MDNVIRFKLIGYTPLLMHNGRLADPSDEFAEQIKEITKKQKKSKDDRERMKRLEFEGGLYFDEDVGPYIPAANVEAFINDGARKFRQGKDALIGICCLTQKAKLVYKGPRSVEGLFAKKEFVDVRSVVIPKGGGRVMRCRPIFMTPWSVDFDISYEPEDVNRDDVVLWAQTAGRKCGLGDATPKYGRCNAEEGAS